MKIIMAGSRDLVLPPDVIGTELRATGWVVSEVVSGGTFGMDKCGEDFARYYGMCFPCKRFPADWNTHGKAAGSIRNREMAEYADAAIIFCREHPTPGSANMCAFNKPAKVVLVQPALTLGER